MADSYILSSDIQEEYQIDLNSIENLKKIVDIDYEKKSNNGEIFLKENKRGRLWSIQINNNSYLILPKKGYEFTPANRTFLVNLFELEKYNPKCSQVIIEKPAIVSYNGQGYDLENKGILNFSDRSLSPVNPQQRDNQKSPQYSALDQTVKDRDTEQKKEDLEIENKKLKAQNKELEAQLKLELERKTETAIKRKESDISVKSESIKKLIVEEIGKYFQEQFPIQLASINETLINQSLSQVADNTKNQLSPINEDIKSIKNNYSLLANEIQQLKEAKPGVEYSRQVPSLDNSKSESTSSIVLNSQQIQNIDSKLDSLNKSLKEIREEQKQFNSLKNSLEQKIADLSNKFQAFNKEIKNDKAKSNQSHTTINIDRESQSYFESANSLLQELKSTLGSLSKEIRSIDQKLESTTRHVTGFAPDFTSESSDETPIEEKIQRVTPLDAESLTDFYNKNPKALSNRVTKVAATKESIEQRRSGIKTPLIFKENDNDSYWIVDDILSKDNFFYLVPKANLIIGDRIYQTVEYIFTCQGYEDKTSNNFELLRPAIVKQSADFEDRWELVQPGKLQFS